MNRSFIKGCAILSLPRRHFDPEQESEVATEDPSTRTPEARNRHKYAA
jgi:hypothetical protein